MRYSYTITVFVGIMLTVFITKAQTIYFDNLYGQSYSFPNTGNTVLINNGKYIIGGNGNYYDFSCFSSSIDLFTIGQNGNLESSMAYSYTTSYSQYSQLIITSDSGYVFVTSRQSCFTPSSSSISLLKLNSAGDSLWSKGLLSGISNDIKTVGSSDLLIAGSNLYYDGVNPTVLDFLLIKVDSTGSILWDTTYGSSNSLESAVSVEVTDSSYMLFGTIKDSLDGYSDIYIVKTDTNGILQWDKRLISPNEIIVYGSISTGDGNYLVYGLEYSAANNDRQAYFIKLDAAGNTIWEKTYGETTFESIYDVVELSNGDIIAVGTAWSGPSNSSGLLLKLNANGDSLWARTYVTQDSIINRFNSIQSTQDGGFIITGESNADMWLLKVDSLGCEIADCTTGIYQSAIADQQSLIVYPNPNTGRFTLEIDLQRETKLSIKLYHFTGQLIHSEVIGSVNGSYSQQMDLSNYAKGVYYVQVVTEAGVITKKVIYQ